MELSFAPFVRDDGSEYCIYEIFNRTTFTRDMLLPTAITNKFSSANSKLVIKCTVYIHADMSAAVENIAREYQKALDDCYQKISGK